MTEEKTRYDGAAPPRPALDDREFSIIKKGYDPLEVKAFLSEVESSWQDLEEWAHDAKARLSIAESRGIAENEVNEAMAAIFDSKERVLESARHQADRIQADAIARVRADQAEVVAKIISQAEEEARRIIQAASNSTESVTEEPVAASKPAEGDQRVDEAQTHSDPVLAGAQREPDRPIDAAYSIAPPQTNEPDEVAPPADSDGASPTVVIHDVDREERPSRYERTSARLPSIGDDAARVAGSLENMKLEIQPTLWERLEASFQRRF